LHNRLIVTRESGLGSIQGGTELSEGLDVDAVALRHDCWFDGILRVAAAAALGICGGLRGW
jgi:hypothetical protein